MSPSVHSERHGRVLTVILDRKERRNAVDPAAATALYSAFKDFEADPACDVAVLHGTGGAFCAGADLAAMAEGGTFQVIPDGDRAPMGPSRLRLTKPVIAAIEGPAVGGGLELALWCDLRIAAQSSYFGVFNRRFGVPLIDLGTIRLPRLVGHGRALDLILTGRRVNADEALAIGLVTRMVPDGLALAEAQALAEHLAALPQQALRHDRLSAYEQWDLGFEAALRNEIEHGQAVLSDGDVWVGARRFAAGSGRHGNDIQVPPAGDAAGSS